jgi:hypothetical protein
LRWFAGYNASLLAAQQYRPSLLERKLSRKSIAGADQGGALPD